MLNDVHDLGLTPETVKRLHERTEGWAAGLYLAVLSMRGRADASGFVESFAGSDQRVVDYLAAEVLGEQRQAELDFLLHISELDSFCAVLCDAVTGTSDSRAMLDRIERVNYFLIPLDPRHEWYRYHHLFRELLRHELERREPGRATELHDRAGRWFLGAGMVSEAIGHLTAAGELDAASELISDHWLAFTNAGQRDTVARWMDQLPRGYIASDGRLCLVQARTALTVGERDEVLRWADLAAQAPRNNPGDDAELGEEVTVVRAAAWQLLGDMRQAEQLGQRLAPLDGSSIWHSLAACLLGTSARWFDATDDAQALLETALKLGGNAQNVIVWMLALGRLAQIAKAFDMRVVGLRRNPAAGCGAADAVYDTAEFKTLLQEADFIALTCPLTDETENLVDAATLSRMKPAAHLVNIARGRVVDETALVEALAARRIAGAGIDVTVEEPLAANSPLWGMEQVLITPHTAGETRAYEDNVIEILRDNVDRLWRGERQLRNQVV